MVEIIKCGNKNVITCGFCGAELRYSTDDIKEREEYISQNSSYLQKYITCPCCKYNIKLG